MFKNIVKAIGGDPQAKDLERMGLLVEEINQLESGFEKLSSQELSSLTATFRDRLEAGETLDDLLPEAFAAVREASKRTIGLRHFNVQLIGGITMHQGKIAEMRTGEGKTLAATLPLYLNALSKKGVHLVTVNDYLARRDARWMAPIYNMLGLSVGVLQMASRTENGRSGFLVDLGLRAVREEDDQLKIIPRNEAYQADITYGTNNEFGFDYLRDNLIMDIRSRVQRGHFFAIVDEIDNILIDEARTPLIISGPASENVAWYTQMAAVVKQLNPEDFDFDEKDRTISLTEIGEIHVEQILQTTLRDPDRPEDITPEQARLLGYLEQALRAELLYRKNKDYVIQNREIIIVDEFTGRLMPGRRWSEGLHQAVEAKEGLKVNPENITHATITLQNYFRKYAKLAGMTGTAVTEAEEFSTIYDLDVLEIPTNLDYEAGKPNTPYEVSQAKDQEGYTYTYYSMKDDPHSSAAYWKRKDYPDIVYRTEEAKRRAICMEIIRFHAIGRPQLVGTTSIEHSETLSSYLKTDSLRVLLTILLIRDQWMRANGIESLERAIPELAPLHEPLLKQTLENLRAFARQLNLPVMNIESSENIEHLLRILVLDANHADRLLSIMRGGIPHQVLNALKHDQESIIIEGAGAFGAVTIATNMAGRGVDIKLGGEIKESVLSEIRLVLDQLGIDPYGMDSTEMAHHLQDNQQRISQMDQEQQTAVATFLSYLNNMKKVRQVGGLHVIGSERHEARRIDNQLRGRAGRQGDPGSSRFYLSLEDELMRMFGGERAENMMRLFNLDPDVPLESRLIGRMVEQAQQRVEGYNFDIRKHLLDYDNILNDQRERIYTERDRVLTKTNLDEDVTDMLQNELEQRLDHALTSQEESLKLLAFLEEIQPTIFFSEIGERLPSFTIQCVADQLKEKTAALADPVHITQAALEIAAETILAEKEHVFEQTRQFVQNAAQTYRQQWDERMESLDIFLDNIDAYQEQSAAQVLPELQKAVRVKISLSNADLTALFTGDQDARRKVEQDMEENIQSTFISRVITTIERRIREKLPLTADNLIGKDWDTIEQTLISALEDSYQRKVDAIHGDNHPIQHNLSRMVANLDQANLGTIDYVQIISQMGVGKQLMIDSRTHQKKYVAVNLLNYIYLAPQYLRDGAEQASKQRILNHMESTKQNLRRIWGKLEMAGIARKQLAYHELSPSYRANLEKHLTGDQLQTIAAADLAKLPSQSDNFMDAFGKKVQQSIYRHVLLKAISDLWIEHLTRMEALRVSIRMEAYAQQDPLVQYKRFATDNFRDLLANIRLAVISRIFKLRPAQHQSAQNTPAPEPKADTAPDGQSSPGSKKKRKRHKKK